MPLPEGFGFQDAVLTSSHAIFRAATVARAGKPAEESYAKTPLSPSPIAVSPAALTEMRAMHDSMCAGVRAILRTYPFSPALQEIVPLPPQVASLLTEHADQFCTAPLGTMRPDILIGADGQMQICEINSRFSLNGFLFSVGLAEAMQHGTAPHLRATPVTAIPATLRLVPALVERLDLAPEDTDNDSTPLWVLSAREKPNDLAWLDGFLETERGAKVAAQRRIARAHPSELAVAADGSTLLARGGPVRRCILELHQDELLNLSAPVLGALMALSLRGRCLNPLWTVFLLHDKRLLHALRSLARLDVDVDEDVAAHLRRCVVPTTLCENRASLEHLLASDALGTSIVLKPVGRGKGQGILLQHHYGPNEARFMAAADAFPYVAQPWVEQKRFDITTDPVLSAPAAPAVEHWRCVATLLSLDGAFFGPGLIRAGARDLIALCGGGHCVPIVMELPVPARTLFFAPRKAALPGAAVHAALARDGVAVMLSHRGVEGDVGNDGALRSPAAALTQLVRDIGGTSRQHSAEVAAVWDVRSQRGGVARSHSEEEFEVHTDASFEQTPPRFIAMPVLRADDCGGGFSGIARVEDATAALSREDFRILHATLVRWRVPKEFQKCDRVTHIHAPVLLSRARARVRRDLIDTDGLDADTAAAFWCAFEAFFGHLQRLCRASHFLLPDGAVIALDNQRFVHMRTAVLDPARHLQRVRFDMQHRPEVSRVLVAALEREAMLATDTTAETALPASVLARAMDLSNWPTQQSTKLLDRIDAEMPRLFHGRGGLYWSPTGGTSSKGGAGVGSERSAVPTAIAENQALRRDLADLESNLGALPPDTVCVNLFGSGKLYRGLEVRGDILVSVGATHLPMGATCSDAELLACVDRFGATMLCGWGSRLVQLAAAALERGIPMRTVTHVVHGGEVLSAAKRKFLASQCSPGCRVFGTFGSAEAGVFASAPVSDDADAAAATKDAPGTDDMALTPLQDEGELYRVVPDGVHVEILDDDGQPVPRGEFGRIVVTNLRRLTHPIVRLDMADEARLVDVPRWETVLQLRGRAETALTMPFGEIWVSWRSVHAAAVASLEARVCAAGGVCLGQLQVDSAGGDALSDVVRMLCYVKYDRARAGVPSDDEVEALRAAGEAALRELLRGASGAVSNVSVEITEDATRLQKSTRSAKMMYFADHRSKA